MHCSGIEGEGTLLEQRGRYLITDGFIRKNVNNLGGEEGTGKGGGKDKAEGQTCKTLYQNSSILFL